MDDDKPSIARTVEVTRRLYRSGESEYLIDGEVCRLRDVHELLMDTGLGAKAYAIIEQGKIGMILSSRPADRRQLIEEAAGITKYKARRRAAELKLEAATQNLTRLEDIIFELEKQFGSLKRQSAKARRYKRLRDELRHWEKLLFAGRYQESAQKIESLRARLVGRPRARDGGRGSGGRGRIGFQPRAHLARRSRSARRRARARRSTHASSTSTGVSSRLSSTASRLRRSRSRADEVRAELAALETRREPGRLLLAERQRAAVAGSAGPAAARPPSWRASNRNTATRTGASRGSKPTSRRRGRRCFPRSTSRRRCGMRFSTPKKRRSACPKSSRSSAMEESEVRMEQERLEGDRAATADGLRRAKEAAEASLHAKTARETELASARIELEWKSNNLRARERELAGLTARLASLTDLEEARAGYTEAARMVLAQANGHVGQQGSVADYLDVEPKYERAVEACLGDLLQHVIVPTHEQAQAGLDLIRQENVGRCGFVVLAGAEPQQHGRTVRSADLQVGH